MSEYSESNLLGLLSKISCSLKDVKIGNRFDYQEINKKYKDAIFKVKDANKVFKSNILSSCLKDKEMLHYYQKHACCWVNYIGCDSFSSQEKRQVFFASVLMEVDDQKKNEELLKINESIFRIYNKSLDLKIPVDIWVQLFFYEYSRLKELLEPSEETNGLLATLRRIQNQGMVIPIGALNRNSNEELATLLYDKTILPVTSSNVEELRIRKDDVKSKDEEIKGILESIFKQEECSSFLTKKVFQLNKSLHQDVRFVYYLPAEGPDGTTGLIVYGASRELEPLEVRDLKLLGYNILFPYVSAYKSAWEGNAVIKESIKTAVAAIMSRNMSHNLGSHYLYYTKSSLETLAAGVRNNGPHVRGAAKVLSYIQGRMDYLATLVANDKYPYGSVNFKSQIWDELTIDDFSMRHYGNHPNLDFKANLTKSIKAAERIQKKAEKLSTLLSNCEGITEEELELKRKSIEGEVGEIYRQVTAIDQNSSYKRTTNYLLANLIRSENYSRPDVISRKNEYRPLFLFVRLWDDNKEEYKLFTGSNDLSIMESENAVKDSLSKINLALPGGTMSCHAFYNILENFIRNSAKYSWTDDAREELTFTVALRVNHKENSVTCTIFDNKHDALRSRDEFHKRTLLEDLQMRLRHHTKVLGANYSVDKENKGLKEMLFSAIWLKANESDDPFANIVAKIEDTPPRRKLKVIKKHAFEFISVDDNGEVSNDTEHGNLALRIILPLFTQVEALDALRIKNLKELLKLHTDVVEVPKTILSMHSNLPRPYAQIFPRLYYASDSVLEETIDNQFPFNLVKIGVDGVDAHLDYRVPSYKLLKSINENVGDINQYWLKIGSFQEPGYDCMTPHSQQVYFSTHLSTKSQKKDILGLMGEYAYVDTISGNNFTKTLEGLFSSGLFPDGYYRSYADLYLAFKIKESALTRITIVDERLFNSIRWNVDVKDKRKGDEQRIDIRNTAVELSMKNIRVLNFLDKARPGAKEVAAKLVDGFPYFYGNKFYSTGPYADSTNATNFLSIHLGLIEKLLKSKKLEGLLGPVGLNPYANNRIERLMKELKSTFGYGTDKKVHISIHSGRGNFSQELEGPLKEYPFISLASLENAFNNSKYLLSQLFYNTTYIGKGEVNH